MVFVAVVTFQCTPLKNTPMAAYVAYYVQGPRFDPRHLPHPNQ
jgi:hypothetical protein